MSGWNDPDKLALARAAHNDFTNRSPGSQGHGRGRGRGRGSFSPSPARDFNDSGDNMTVAGRGRGGPPTPARGGLGGLGGTNTARGGGSVGRNRPAAPLATSEQFFSLLDSKKTNVPTGGSAAVSSTYGTSAAPGAQKTFAQNTNNFSGGGPMDLDQPAHSSITTTSPSDVLTATQGNAAKVANTSGGPMNLDKHAKSNASPLESENIKPGLMSSCWGKAAGASGTGTGTGTGTGAHRPANAIHPQGTVTTSTNNFGTHTKTDQHAGTPKDAQSKAGANHGLVTSLWARSPPSPPAIPSELAPIYRSQNWMEDLREDNEAEAKRRAAVSPAAPPGQVNGRQSNSVSRGPNKDPTMGTPAASSVGSQMQARASNVPAQQAARPASASGVSMRSQADVQRPSAIQSGTQPGSQQSVNFNQLPVDAARPAVGRTQAYQTSSSRLPTQGRAQPIPGGVFPPAAGAHASLNAQPRYVSGGLDGPRSSAGSGAGPTAQSIEQPAQRIGSNVGQQPHQAARPAGGGIGQQSAQPAQRSQDPFDDPDFKDFYDNHYLPNNG